MNDTNKYWEGKFFTFLHMRGWVDDYIRLRLEALGGDEFSLPYDHHFYISTGFEWHGQCSKGTHWSDIALRWAKEINKLESNV